MGRRVSHRRSPKNPKQVRMSRREDDFRVWEDMEPPEPRPTVPGIDRRSLSSIVTEMVWARPGIQHGFPQKLSQDSLAFWQEVYWRAANEDRYEGIDLNEDYDRPWTRGTPPRLVEIHSCLENVAADVIRSITAIREYQDHLDRIKRNVEVLINGEPYGPWTMSAHPNYSPQENTENGGTNHPDQSETEMDDDRVLSYMDDIEVEGSQTPENRNPAAEEVGRRVRRRTGEPGTGHEQATRTSQAEPARRGTPTALPR